jgi:Holliday junction DNA helicase RuvA
MLYSVRGKLIHTEPGMAVVECGGVGYRLFVTLPTLQRLPPRGGEAMLHTYLHIKEDALDLYGFAEPVELQSFKLLLSVSGVGPRVALSLLSDLSPERLALAVLSGDAKTLGKSQGVGPKLAGRIVLELKDKMGGMQSGLAEALPLSEAAGPGDRGSRGEAVSALTALGYTPSEAALAVAGCDPSAPVQEIIKFGLKALTSRR